MASGATVCAAEVGPTGADLPDPDSCLAVAVYASANASLASATAAAAGQEATYPYLGSSSSLSTLGSRFACKRCDFEVVVPCANALFRLLGIRLLLEWPA